MSYHHQRTIVDPSPPALSQRKRASINKRKEQWKLVLSNGKDERQPVTRTADPHRSDRRSRLQLVEDTSFDRSVRRKEPRQVRREVRAEIVQSARRTLKIHVEEDAVDKLRDRRLQEKLERDRLRREELRQKLEMEMAAPPKPAFVMPKSEPRKRQRRSSPTRVVNEPTWLEAFVSTLLAAAACCSGEEYAREANIVMDPPQ